VEIQMKSWKTAETPDAVKNFLLDYGKEVIINLENRYK